MFEKRVIIDPEIRHGKPIIKGTSFAHFFHHGKQLMSLCAAPETGLLRSHADSERLIRAVVGRMLAGDDSV